MVPLRSPSAPDSRIGEAILPDSEPTNKAFGHKTYKTFAKSWHISSLPMRSLNMIAPSRGIDGNNRTAGKKFSSGYCVQSTHRAAAFVTHSGHFRWR